MHRKPESDLSILDTELERTLRNLRKVKRAGEATMADERDFKGKILWRISRDLSSKKNTQQIDNLLWKPTTSS